MPQEVSKGLAELEERRQDLQRLTADLNARTRNVTRLLIGDLGLSYRDAANLLGLSQQRIGQLLTD